MFKKSRVLWVGVASAFALSFAVGTTALAEKKLISLTWKTQEKTNWCWLASAQNSVRAALGTAKSQTETAKYILGSDKNESGTSAQTAKAAKYMSNNAMTYSYTSLGSPKNFYFLKNQIDCGSIPIVGGGYYALYGRTGGHACIVVGYVSGKTNYIYYYDPYPQDNRVYYAAYDSFANGAFNGRVYDTTIYYNVC